MSIQEKWQQWKKRISSLKNIDFLLVSAFFSVVIFGFGFCSGAKEFSPKPKDQPPTDPSPADILKVLVPTVGGVVGVPFFLLFVNGYVQGSIDQYKQKLKCQDFFSSEEVEKELRGNFDLEFLAGLHKPEDYKKFNLNNFGAVIEETVQEKSFKAVEKKIEEYCKEKKHREQAIKALSKGFTKDPDGSTPFLRLIVEVCNQSVGINHTEPTIELALFYEDLREYLEAWLYSSLYYGIPIPIKPQIHDKLKINIPASSSSGKKENLELGLEHYEKSIQKIKEYDRSYMRKHFFTTEESIDVFNEYLEKLVFLLKCDESNPKKDAPD